jgi:hypothetical protein
MDNTFTISIPLDKDGFLELECDYCRGRFMLTKEIFEDDDNLNFYCPICGIPNRINTFYCPEVLEKANQVAMNYALDEIYKTLSKDFKSFNKNGVFKLTVDKPKPVPVSELFVPIHEYKKIHLSCCEISIKATSFDETIGVYCPLCGETKL